MVIAIPFFSTHPITPGTRGAYLHTYLAYRSIYHHFRNVAISDQYHTKLTSAAFLTLPIKDKLTQVENKVAEVKEILLDNLRELEQRGESLESLKIKADDLVHVAEVFKRKATPKCCLLM